MANWKSLQATNAQPLMNANGANDPIAVVATFVVPAGIANGDVIEMGGLPGGYVPIDLIVAFPDMDTGAGITFEGGMLSGNWLDAGARTCGSEFFTANTTAQTGGIARMNLASGAQIAPTSNDRSWGLKMSHAVGTALTAGGTITATMMMRPRISGI